MEAESLEEGEVIDDEVDPLGVYNVLQRPHIAKTCDKPPKTEYSDDSDETSASASDSDSDSAVPKIKKQKVKLKRAQGRPTSRLDTEQYRAEKDNRFNVWCAQIQEDSLTENLVSCGVTNKMFQSRNVENYDFPGRYSQADDEDERNSSEEDQDVQPRLTNKRTNADRKNVKLRIGKRRNSMEVDGQKGSAKIMDELSSTVESTESEVASDIAAKLSESKDSLIKTVVDTIGKAKAMEFYEKTKKIEEDGGMLIMNGSRRRTAGGIYLWLVKNDDHIPQEKIREIFSMDKKEISKQRKKFDATNRRQKAQQELRRGLEDGSKADLPALLTRAELSTRQIAEEARLRRGEGMDRNLPDSDRTVSNPPPSPVTDDPDHSEHHQQQQQQQNLQEQQQQVQLHTNSSSGQRRIQSYNDDFLDIGLDVDSMEVF